MTQVSVIPTNLRQRTSAFVRRLGILENPHLPLLEECISLCKTADEVGVRALCLSAIVSASFDIKRIPTIKEWLEKNSLTPRLTNWEQRFLDSPTEHSINRSQWRSESLFALCWATLIDNSDVITQLVPDDLVFRMPRIRGMDLVEPFLKTCRLRPLEELAQAVDTLYCMHWAVRQSQLDGRRVDFPIHPVAIYERRYALEWLLSEQDWESIELDT